jgi:hypothetical protein
MQVVKGGLSCGSGIAIDELGGLLAASACSSAEGLKPLMASSKITESYRYMKTICNDERHLTCFWLVKY